MPEITIPKATPKLPLKPFNKETHKCCFNCTPIAAYHCGHNETLNDPGIAV